MKVCAIIAEYNPLHLGHLRQIDYVKNVLGAEKTIVIMSGNFTQRGEPAIMNKFKRAKQAVTLGVDAVIELPSVFATANAEVFAKGAISVLNSLNIVDGICFGVESGEKDDYLSLAKAMNDESKEFKKSLREKLETGISLAKAKFEALKSIGRTDLKESLISSPNNILGLEYTKAILSLNSNIEIFPLKRDGDHNDLTLKKGITSAKSIRARIKAGKAKKIKKYLPKNVYGDLSSYPYAFDNIIMSHAMTSSAEELERTPDCTEGLENRIKALLKDNLTLEKLVEKVSTKRYTQTRITRILTCNLLGITKNLVKDAVSSPSYAKILAADSDSDIVSLICANSSIPVLTRKSDTLSLKKTAEECFNVDVLANELYNLVCGEKENENQTLFI